MDSGQLPAVQGKPFFEATCWKHFEVEFFKTIKRQSDQEFIEALNLIRKGEAEEAADWFEANVGFVDEVDENWQGLTFFSVNNEVNAFNTKCLSKIPNNPVVYRAVLTDKADSSWKSLPTRVIVKKGALIRMLFNNIDNGWANGDIAYITELFKNTIRAKLVRSAAEICIPYSNLENVNPLNGKTLGKLRIMQVKLAYASTIHSAQGLTTDGAQISLGHPFLQRLSGGLYTALSRVRTKQGLRLVGTKEQFIKSCYLDKTYLPWIK